MDLRRNRYLHHTGDLHGPVYGIAPVTHGPNWRGPRILRFDSGITKNDPVQEPEVAHVDIHAQETALSPAGFYP